MKAHTGPQTALTAGVLEAIRLQLEELLPQDVDLDPDEAAIPIKPDQLRPVVEWIRGLQEQLSSEENLEVAQAVLLILGGVSTASNAEQDLGHPIVDDHVRWLLAGVEKLDILDSSPLSKPGPPW